MQLCWFSFFTLCAFVISLTVSLPTTVETDHVTTSPDTVPREFPNLNQNYKFVDNSSIRENLASHSEIDTEVDDLLGKDVKEESVENPPKNEENQTKVEESQNKIEENSPKNEESVQNSPRRDEDLGRKGVIEWIEDGDDTEDNKFGAENQFSSTTEKDETTKTTEETTTEKKIETTEKPTTSEKTISETEIKENATTVTEESSEPYKDGVPVIDGSVAAILIGLFLVVCIFGYTALILWRRSLEIKYGSREMLVDKDDMFDPDDLKHFSI